MDRMLQTKIVVGALFGGSVVFLCVAVVVVTTGAVAPSVLAAGPIFLGAWIAISAGSFVAWPLIRKSLAARAALTMTGPSSSSDREKALESYSIATIVGAALAEGSGLVAITFGLVTGQVFWFGLACIPVIAIVFCTPTDHKFERFVASARAGSGVTTPR